MPNTENINKVIDVLRNETLVKSYKIGFNMMVWKDSAPDRLDGCDTCCCIGGTANMLEAIEQGSLWAYTDGRVGFHRSHTTAAAWLGLNSTDADKLFYPYNVCVKGESDWSRITPAAAIACLEHLRDTGEVNWNRALALHPLLPVAASDGPIVHASEGV